MSIPFHGDDVPLTLRKSTGFIFFAGIILGVYAFAVVAVFKAVRRRTTRWVIAGSCGGLILLTTWLLTMGVAGFGMYGAYWNITKKKVPLFRDSYIPHTMQGWMVAYKITLPEGWTPSWSDLSFDMTAEQDGLHLGVVAGQSVGGIEVIERMARDKVRTVAQEASVGESSSIQIAGRTWERFTAQFRMADSTADYHQCFYVYSGPEGMFQVVGWRIGGFQGKDMDTLRNIALSFQFPLGPGPPLPVPMVVQGDKFAYRLMVPKDWTVEYPGNGFDLKASHGLLSVRVIVTKSQTDKMTERTETVIDSAKNILREETIGLQTSETATVKIDGRDWQHFTAKLLYKKVPYVQEYYAYVGPEGFFQVIGWTRRNENEADKSAISDVVMSFRFPPQS